MSGILGKRGVAGLKAWVERGGVLIGLGRANRFVWPGATCNRRRATCWRGSEQGRSQGTADWVDDCERRRVRGSDCAQRGRAFPLPGVILRTEVDRDHWLAAGLTPTLNFVVTGGDIYQPLKRDAGVNVVRFAAEESIAAGGHVWEDTRAQLAFKPVVMAAPQGKGHVIGVTADPSFRGFLDGLSVLLGNALLRAPAYAGY